MISPELLRRYQFCAGLSYEQIVTLAKMGQELNVEAGHTFFCEGDTLAKFYLVVEGAAALIIEVPDQAVEQKLSDQLLGDLQTKEIVITALGPGEMFGWSALIPPHQATTSGKATTPCRVIAIDSPPLLQLFKDDCQFGYLMIQKTAQIVRERLQALRIESLSHMMVG